MARIWQEGFEDGLPNFEYLEGTPNSQNIHGLALNNFPNTVGIASGRNTYSQYAIKIQRPGNTAGFLGISKTVLPTLSELYFRTYIKLTDNLGVDIMKELIGLSDGTNYLFSIYHTTAADPTAFAIYARIGGIYASVQTLTLQMNTWYKVDMYYKINASTGAYEIKIDDISIKSASSVNTGTNNIAKANIGYDPAGSPNCRYIVNADDIALNDTSGSANNSWCGSGTIVALKPKAAGNSTQWDTCQGYALGESGTTTTNVKITAHGLSTNDVCYNKTRDAYRIVTYVDADNFTVSSVTSQTTGDVFINFTNVATIAATAGTTTSLVVIAGHTLVSYDVIVNTSRSNAIRRVVYVNGTSVYNTYATTANGTLGSTVTSQASGDSIKTFKVKQYAIANHWETVSKSDPNPQVCNIQTTTSGDIDLFDMTELTADLGIPSTASIVAVSANIYAQEAGAGSQIKPVLRISGTNYEGSTITLSSGTLEYQTIYDVSPATSSAFSRSEIDAIEAGVKLV